MDEIDEGNLLTQAWEESKETSVGPGPNGWHNTVRNFRPLVIEGDPNEMKTKLRELWWEEAKVNTSSKTTWYNSLKTTQGGEKYLRKNIDPIGRNCTTRFRFGSHWLKIETGLWEGLKEKERRICPSCKAQGKNIVEDESHMLKTCPIYDRARQNFKVLEFNRSPQEIMNDHRVITLGKFLWGIFENSLFVSCVFQK